MSQRNVKILGQQVDGMTPEQAIPYLLKSLHHLLRGVVEERLREERIEMSFAHFAAQRYDEALRHAQRSHDMRPGHPYPLVMAAACAGQLGLTERAASLARDLTAVLPRASTGWVEATSPYVRAEDRARLVEGLRSAGLN